MSKEVQEAGEQCARVEVCQDGRAVGAAPHEQDPVCVLEGVGSLEDDGDAQQLQTRDDEQVVETRLVGEGAGEQRQEGEGLVLPLQPEVLVLPLRPGALLPLPLLAAQFRGVELP